ncbi:Peptidase S8/S53 subtilisin kexin sedolisin [Ignavibacterium album JCM 16511]|uniref:Peptidase S8/S53 subtilisin kexin sedolisin n=1 Tax=Ignavibacterium album (strain DSM 19864 / JCM 16511 / NBRC 101810 / Mat9-16) TaxID=945713 RepID=I0ANE4_IGNAJ|nr:T9SS type A sorting domain-containing protein [Ignavibacterium album]AFH50501.1 Peptidase S8/S53 subtilisin kexin sedolisin [Ignavibacterium album JCM 16511]
MKTNKILIVIFFLLLIIENNAQNTYNVQPGVKNNQIVLQLSNVSTTESTSKVEVKLIRNSKNLKFNQTEKIIENITQGTETEVGFIFDVDYNIKNAEADTIEFLITDNKSIYQTKQFILQYTQPTEYKLEQNYPNPFNPTTKIRYSIPNVGTGLALSTLKVYDILGNEVVTLVNEEKPAGYYEIEFNATELSSGVYFYRLQSGNFTQTKKMVLMR